MSDPGFREIQLGGKHVVFLFLLGVVAAVGVFLLGVSVGRGVTGGAPESSAALGPDAPGVGTSEALPPAATPAPGELAYHETLQGKPPAEPPVGSPAATPTPTPVVPPAPATKPSPTPVPPQADAVWWVQVNSFSSRDNAMKQVSQLKDKGIASTIYTAPGAGARYKVRVGPFDRAAADAMDARLRKDGYKPSVIR